MIRLAAVLFTATILTISTLAGRAVGDDGKCTIATKGDSPTAKACAKGGRAEAKKMMKDMVKQAKAAGQKFTCDGCHKDLDNYELTKNAVHDFKKLEAVAYVKQVSSARALPRRFRHEDYHRILRHRPARGGADSPGPSSASRSRPRSAGSGRG